MFKIVFVLVSRMNNIVNVLLEAQMFFPPLFSADAK